MKKTLLLFSVFAFSLSHAQSITVDDTLSTGEVMYYYAGDTSVTNYDAITGTGVTWDYSNLAYLELTSTTAMQDTVIDIVNSPFASDYPGADYHDNFNTGVQTFLSNTPDSVITHGFVFNDGSSDYVIRYNIDPLTSAKFPMTQGVSYTDAIDGDAVLPTVGVTALSGSATVSVDGTGTLMLGGATYTDVVRVKTVEVLNGNITLIGPVTVTRTSYVYYSNSTSNMPVFIHGQVFADLGASGSIDLKTIWSKDMLSGFAGVEDEIVTAEVSIYPNPASTIVTINSNKATELVIYNAIGKEIKVITKPATTENINVAHLPNGIYFVQVKNGNTVLTKKIVIK